MDKTTLPEGITKHSVMPYLLISAKVGYDAAKKALTAEIERQGKTVKGHLFSTGCYGGAIITHYCLEYRS